jgi:hypothetical protein
MPVSPGRHRAARPIRWLNMASIVAMVETLVAIPSRFIAASFA